MTSPNADLLQAPTVSKKSFKVTILQKWRELLNADSEEGAVGVK